MKLVKKTDGAYYDAKKHFNCWTATKLSTDTDSKTIKMSLSHFLPNGGAEFSSSPLERVYYVLSGALNIKGANEEYTVETGDMIYIGAGEEREFTTVNNEPATILVIMAAV